MATVRAWHHLSPITSVGREWAICEDGPSAGPEDAWSARGSGQLSHGALLICPSALMGLRVYFPLPRIPSYPVWVSEREGAGSQCPELPWCPLHATVPFTKWLLSCPQTPLAHKKLCSAGSLQPHGIHKKAAWGSPLTPDPGTLRWVSSYSPHKVPRRGSSKADGQADLSCRALWPRAGWRAGRAPPPLWDASKRPGDASRGG